MSNLSRTVYRYEDVGRPKVDALADRLRTINPDVDVRPLRMAVSPRTAEELAVLLKDCDLALGLADDNHAMSVLDVKSHEVDTPAVFAGVYRAGVGGDIVIVIPGLTACWRCTVGPRKASADLQPDVSYETGRLAGEIAPGTDVATASMLTARTALGVLGTLAGTDTFLGPTLAEGLNFVSSGARARFL